MRAMNQELLVHVTVSEWSFSAAVQEVDLAWLRRTVLLVVPMRHITASLHLEARAEGTLCPAR